MPSGPLNRPLSRLFRPTSPLTPSLTEQISALDAASPEQLAAIAMGKGEDALRAAAIERLPDGQCLRALAGLPTGAAPFPDFVPLAQQRLATLIDRELDIWTNLRAAAETPAALRQIAELCSSSVPLEQVVALIQDPNEIARLVVEGSSIRLRQLLAQRVEDREDLNRLLKQLQGKDKSVYRILKDKRDALRSEAQQAAHIEQDIRTIYTSLEALLSRPYDTLVAPALEHFEARWRSYEGQAHPWARDRVGAALQRCHEAVAAHLLEIEQHEARLAEQAARAAALQSAREDALAQAAQAARDREEAAARDSAAAEESRRAEQSARLERQAAQAHALRQIAALIARAHGALRAGHTGPAAGLRRAIEERLTAVPALPPALARGIQELDGKLHALKEWKDYAVSPKRAELIAEMEALVGSEEPPAKLADRIKDLRAQWKTISQGVMVDSETDWQRFNQAASTAYEPCRVHFEAQARLRAENVEKRSQVLERLRAFETNQDGEHPDWRAIGTVLFEAPQAWRRTGPVDRRAVRELEVEFDASLGRLRGRLEAWQTQNAAGKRSLIAQAKALLEKPNSLEAVEGIKALQYRWRDIGPAPREAEGSLWSEFREQCDGVFRKREQAYAEHAASLEGNKVQALSLCEELEQLHAESGPSLLESAKSLPQRRAAFDALGELPRADARSLQERFNRALSQCELKVRGQRAHDAAQVLENLMESTQRIQAYGWAIANKATAVELDALKAEADSFIAGVAQWPKSGASVLKEAWAKAEQASTAELAPNETALRMLCVRAEIATERATPAEDQALRRSYQLQRLVQGMGQRQEPTVFNWEALVLEWAGVGPVPPAMHESLLARFRQCRP